VLAVKWIEQNRGPVPMEFGRLLVTIEEQETLCDEIAQLINRKRNGDELDRGPANATIGIFIDQEMKRHRDGAHRKNPNAPDHGLLQALFLRRLENASINSGTT